MKQGKQVGFFWATSISTPRIYSAVSLFSQNAIHVLALASWLVTWWISEAAPIPVTALLPLILFPALGVMTMTECCNSLCQSGHFFIHGWFYDCAGIRKT